jgi:nicotinamidase-related amidase
MSAATPALTALDLQQAALLVIDVQCGAFDGRLCPPMPDGDSLVRACEQAIGWARRRGVPVLWIQHSEPSGPMDGPGFDIDPRLTPRPDEARFTKTTPNALEVPSLVQALTQRGVRQPILVGLQSDCCIEGTTLGALALGLQPWVVSDAHHTWPDRGLSAEALRDQISAQLAQAGATLLSLHTLVSI